MFYGNTILVRNLYGVRLEDTDPSTVWNMIKTNLKLTKAYAGYILGLLRNKKYNLKQHTSIYSVKVCKFHDILV